MNPVNTTDLLSAIQVGTTDLRNLPDQISGISLDTRSLKPNDIFWAISGTKFDGHDFIEEAIRKRATACIVKRSYNSPSQLIEERLIRVDDTLQALGRFAAWYRAQFQAKTIGITGSYGKTTTRELCFSVLSTKHKCLQNKGNQNNEIGVPLTILKLETDHQFLIAELGAAKPGDIRPLTKITTPQIGLITGIGPAHLTGFQTQEQIIQTKGDLIASLPADGLAFIPGGEEWSDQLAERANCPVVTFGINPNNRYHATHIASSNAHLSLRTQNKQYTLPLIGRHHLTTGLAAVAVATELGYSPEEIQQGFNCFEPVPGRGRVVQTEPWTIIDDTYNASPSATSAACRMLADWQTQGKRYLVLGDMLELGPSSRKHHEEMGRLAAKLGIDFIFAYGQYARHVAAGVQSQHTSTQAVSFDDQQNLISELKKWISIDDAVLVKGSRSMQMERVVQELTKTTIPERAVA